MGHWDTHPFNDFPIFREMVEHVLISPGTQSPNSIVAMTILPRGTEYPALLRLSPTGVGYSLGRLATGIEGGGFISRSRSSVEEHWPVKPGVVGSCPTEIAIQPPGDVSG